MSNVRRPEPNTPIKVLLIGGTSLTGKSTLARRLAAELEWNLLSTDELARHPGRPWADYGSVLPDDVTEHYSSLTAGELADAVLTHYQQNVWPIAEAMVRCRVNNPYDPCLVLEGSALLPDLAAAASFERVASIWITAAEALLTRRIHHMSRYQHKAAPEQHLIDGFLQRAVIIDGIIRETAQQHGLHTVDAEADHVFEQLRALSGRRALR